MPVMKCQVDNKPGWKWGEHGKCYTYTAGDEAGSDAAKKKAEKQGAAAHAAGYSFSPTGFTLLHCSAPAVSMATEWTPREFVRFKKELIKVGHWVSGVAGATFNVTQDRLYHWARTFHKWVAAGNRVTIPLSHGSVNDPRSNQGWVENMWVEGDSLVGTMSLLNPDLALTNDVSIWSPEFAFDGHGLRYEWPITHVTLTTNPAVPGLEKFKKLSLSKGDTDMDPKTLAKLLGLAEDASEEVITAEITKLKAPPVTIAASQTVSAVDPLLVQVSGKLRTGQLDTLVAAGLLIPACKDIISKRFVETQALTLSLSKGPDDGFDTLVEVLSKNTPVALGDGTGPQTLIALSNPQTQQPSGMQVITNRKREAYKDKPGYVVPIAN